MANQITFKTGTGAPDDAGDGVLGEPLYDYNNHKLYISDDNDEVPKEVGSSTYLPLAGGALTGNLTTTHLIDGRDVAADGATADAALPKAGGTMTGNISLDGNYLSGDGGDEGLQIDSDGDATFSRAITTEGIAYFQDGAVGAPGIAFENDTDTGIYRNGDNTLAFGTKGTISFAVSTSQQIWMFGDLQAYGTTTVLAPTSDMHAATRKYVDETRMVVLTGGYNYGYGAGTKVWIPLAGNSTVDITGTSETGYPEYINFIAPYNGTLQKVILRSEESCRTTLVGFHLGSDNAEMPSTSATSDVEVEMTSDDTSYEFDFSGETNTFTKGQIVGISVTPESDMNDVAFTVVFQMDSTT